MRVVSRATVHWLDLPAAVRGRGHAGTDVRSKSYATRRALLEDLLGRQLSHGIVLMPMTTDLAVARTWMHDNVSPGVEGVVLKHLAHTYRPGTRRWTKVRTRTTTEAIVGGNRGPRDAPEAPHQPSPLPISTADLDRTSTSAGVARAPELAGPDSSRRSRPRVTSANAGAALVFTSKPRWVV